MSWLVRCLAWATVLAAPSTWIAVPYQGLLIGVVTGILHLPPQASHAGHVDLAAANALGLYAAMCFASSTVPMGRRAFALVVGGAALVALEVAVGVCSIAMALQATPNPMMARLMQPVLEAQRWLSPPLAWVLFLGRRSLPPNLGAAGARHRRNPRCTVTASSRL